MIDDKTLNELDEAEKKATEAPLAQENTKLRAELVAARDALASLHHHDRWKGYPTGQEWIGIVQFIKAASKRIDDSGLLEGK